jgi:hypothetical protein
MAFRHVICAAPQWRQRERTRRGTDAEVDIHRMFDIESRSAIGARQKIQVFVYTVKIISAIIIL